MNTYPLLHFNDLDLDNLEEYYETRIDFNGHEVSIDLNFENTTISRDQMDIVGTFLASLTELDKKALHAMKDDLVDGTNTVKEYLEFHLEEFDEADLKRLQLTATEPGQQQEQMITRLQLVRIGFYPDDPKSFAMMDYSFGRDITNYLLVIVLNDQEMIEDITMES